MKERSTCRGCQESKMLSMDFGDNQVEEKRLNKEEHAYIFLYVIHEVLMIKTEVGMKPHHFLNIEEGRSCKE